MGLADEHETNLVELCEETLRVNAADAFSVAIAATVRRVIGNASPVLQIESRGKEPADDALSASPHGADLQPA